MPREQSDDHPMDITYTNSFYRDMTPGLLALSALAAGRPAPDPSRPLDYCELGCGHGFVTNLLAAANPHIRFHANDFSPAHISTAQGLAVAAGLDNVHFMDSSFAEMAARTDLPDFDIIALHGVYSWISAENRRTIVRFIADRLKPGGLVYISYNALPGLANILSLRRLLTHHPADEALPMRERVGQSLRAAQALAASNALFFQSNPGMAERLAGIGAQPLSYVAHEYFGQHWTPFHHADLAGELSAAGLNWAGPARAVDGVEELNFTPGQLALLSTAAGSRREELKDYILNQQFRCDLFVKGTDILTPSQAAAAWQDTRFALTAPASDLHHLRLPTPLGERVLAPESYEPIIEQLARGPATAGQLAGVLPAMDRDQIHRMLVILTSHACAHPCVREPHAAARSQTDRFNRVLLEQAGGAADICFLASPVTGGAFAIDPATRLLLASRLAGGGDPVSGAWKQMCAANQRLARNGQLLMTEEENLAELRARDAVFMEKVWPVLGLLKIV